MEKYVCQVCGYVYDPAQGDPDSGIAPVPNLPIYPMTGSAPSAERPRAILKKNRITRRRGDQSDDVLF